MGVTGAAYTNNDFEPNPATAKTGTTLFDIDTMLDQVVIQSPPNNGILVATGKLGVDADAAGGLRHLYPSEQGRGYQQRWLRLAGCRRVTVFIA